MSNNFSEDKRVSPPDEGILEEDLRVKVLSPEMLVIKRFFRNKLAILGLIILVLMFVFSFLGAVISPYGEKQVFYKQEEAITEFASVGINNSQNIIFDKGVTVSASVKNRILQAAKNGETELVIDNNTYRFNAVSDNFCEVFGPVTVAKCSFKVKRFNLTSNEGNVSDAVIVEFQKAMENGIKEFKVDNVDYSIINLGSLNYALTNFKELGFITYDVFDVNLGEDGNMYEFGLNAEKAIESGAYEFVADNKNYVLKNDGPLYTITTKDDNKEIGTISKYSIKAKSSDVVLSADFKQVLLSAIVSERDEFTFGDDNTTYTLKGLNGQYTVKTLSTQQKIDMFAFPSKDHWLGTDGNGMDNLTRLMYGGQISLFIGFIVVIIEIIIGVILGGIAGYFGGWVDNLLMRTVDIIYCIPSMPLYIMIGSIMDQYKVDPQVRIYLLMVILGVLSWPGIARMVRGQILSLREQEFMIAAEATGLSVKRKIFKHLIPNVIPQLIVIATMDLGGIILTEATLSFLGLGVKFPFASWGNIINAVSSIYVMTNYWFVWIPAGFLILITVLGFNFVGDGLRDAFDPKMKR